MKSVCFSHGLALADYQSGVGSDQRTLSNFQRWQDLLWWVRQDACPIDETEEVHEFGRLFLSEPRTKEDLGATRVGSRCSHAINFVCSADNRMSNVFKGHQNVLFSANRQFELNFNF